MAFSSFTHEYIAAMPLCRHARLLLCINAHTYLKSIPTHTACMRGGPKKKVFFGPQWASQRVISCSSASVQDSRSAEANQRKT